MATRIESFELSLNIEGPRFSHQVALFLLLREMPDSMLEVLVANRTDGSGVTFPGGGIDPFEDPLSAATRELREETGMKLDQDLLLSVNDPRSAITPDGKRFTVHPFFAYGRQDSFTRPKTLEPHKHDFWRWEPLSQLRFYVANRRLPQFIYDTHWMDVALRQIFFEHHLPHDQYEKVPAHFLQECQEIRYETLYREYRKGQLGFDPRY